MRRLNLVEMLDLEHGGPLDTMGIMTENIKILTVVCLEIKLGGSSKRAPQVDSRLTCTRQNFTGINGLKIKN